MSTPGGLEGARRLRYRFASEADLPLLAEWNYQLIRDQGHRNPMTVEELHERMRGWLGGEYRAVVFDVLGEPAAYALFCETAGGLHLRQFFVARAKRRSGVGRAAIKMLRKDVWPRERRIIVEVLVANPGGLEFWRSVGFSDYSVALEMLPDPAGGPL